MYVRSLCFNPVNVSDILPEIPSAQPRETTRKYGLRLWALIRRIGKESDIFSPKERQAKPKPEPKLKKSVWLMRFLEIFPYFLGIVFIVSLFWDLDGVSVHIAGNTIALDGLMRILSVSGIISFLTNWLAITMLFRPEKKRPIFGHGLIPSQKEIIAFRLAQAVSTDLINPDIIQKKIAESGVIPMFRDKSITFLRGITDHPDFREELKNLTAAYMRDLVADPDVRASLAVNILKTLQQSVSSKKIEKFALNTYLSVRGSDAQEIVEQSIANLPENIERMLDKLDQLLDVIPEKLENRSDQIETLMTQLLYRLVNQLDVHALIEENIAKFEEQRLEKMIKSATNDQLRYIQYLGAVLGVIGGFVIWSPVPALIVLGAIGGVLLTVDHLLLKFRA